MMFSLTIFNFFARRIFGPSCVFVGTILALTNIGAILPGGTINMNGAPTDDLVLRIFAVVWPSVMAVLGVALYRAKPYAPK